jgi:hypothetical protein
VKFRSGVRYKKKGIAIPAAGIRGSRTDITRRAPRGVID